MFFCSAGDAPGLPRGVSSTRCPWLAQGRLTLLATHDAQRLFFPRFPATAEPPPGNAGRKCGGTVRCSEEPNYPPGKRSGGGARSSTKSTNRKPGAFPTSRRRGRHFLERADRRSLTGCGWCGRTRCTTSPRRRRCNCRGPASRRLVQRDTTCLRFGRTPAWRRDRACGRRRGQATWSAARCPDQAASNRARDLGLPPAPASVLRGSRRPRWKARRSRPL